METTPLTLVAWAPLSTLKRGRDRVRLRPTSCNYAETRRGIKEGDSGDFFGGGIFSCRVDVPLVMF